MASYEVSVIGFAPETAQKWYGTQRPGFLVELAAGATLLGFALCFNGYQLLASSNGGEEVVESDVLDVQRTILRPAGLGRAGAAAELMNATFAHGQTAGLTLARLSVPDASTFAALGKTDFASSVTYHVLPHLKAADQDTAAATLLAEPGGLREEEVARFFNQSRLPANRLQAIVELAGVSALL